jgi:alpha-N-acetylglucosaminidase
LTYLRDWGGDIYWTGDMFTDRYLDRQLTDATSWNGSSWAEWRYLFSTATFSYTMAWWDWPRWEYLLDWASLHGINLPLAMVGQE